MKDFAYVADRIIGGAFAPFFSEELPPYLGREILLAIRRRLRVAGRYLGDEHVDEVFQRVVVEAYSYLARHGSNEVRHVRGWLHRISIRVTRSYLLEYFRFDSLTTSSLNAAVDSEIQPLDDSNDELLRRVSEAINNLKPRYQEVVRLDLIERLPSAEVQERMRIASFAYFRRLRCEALKALRKEISRRFGTGFIEKPDRSRPTFSLNLPVEGHKHEGHRSLRHEHKHGH